MFSSQNIIKIKDNIVKYWTKYMYVLVPHIHYARRRAPDIKQYGPLSRDRKYVHLQMLIV